MQSVRPGQSIFGWHQIGILPAEIGKDRRAQMQLFVPRPRRSRKGRDNQRQGVWAKWHEMRKARRQLGR